MTSGHIGVYVFFFVATSSQQQTHINEDIVLPCGG